MNLEVVKTKYYPACPQHPVALEQLVRQAAWRNIRLRFLRELTQIGSVTPLASVRRGNNQDAPRSLIV